MVPVALEEAGAGEGEHQKVVPTAGRATNPLARNIPADAGNDPPVGGHRIVSFCHSRIVQLFSRCGYCFSDRPGA